MQETARLKIKMIKLVRDLVEALRRLGMGRMGSRSHGANRLGLASLKNGCTKVARSITAYGANVGIVPIPRRNTRLKLSLLQLELPTTPMESQPTLPPRLLRLLLRILKLKLPVQMLLS